MIGRTVQTGPFDLAMRFVGVSEVPGSKDNPAILAMLRLDNDWPESDEVPWCSGFVNVVAWLLRLPRSKSLRARSWLNVGCVVGMPELGDIVVLTRGKSAPGPEDTTAPGHVGFYAGFSDDGLTVYVLGGNQDNSVSVKGYSASRVLGFRRIVR